MYTCVCVHLCVWYVCVRLCTTWPIFGGERIILWTVLSINFYLDDMNQNQVPQFLSNYG